jgi:MFS transporter, PPP family, 3-phenylpropionic acid transporter
MSVISPAQASSTEAIRTTQLLYIGMFLAFGVHAPFLSLHLKNHGFTPTELGLYISMFSFARVVVPPLLGFWADAGWGGVRLLRIVSIISLLGGVGLVLSPSAGTLSFIAITVYSIGRAPVVPLADGVALSALGKSDPILFGRMRLFGSASFWVASFICAIFYDFVSAHTFEVALIFGLLVAVFVSFWAEPFELKITRPTWKDFQELIHKPLFVGFLVVAFVVKLAESTFDVYLGIRLSAVGANWTTISIAWGLSILPEIVLFAYAGPYMSRIGLHRVLPFCAMIAALRWLLVGGFDSLWVLLLSQPLHAITFAAYYSASVAHVANCSADKLRHSGQAIFGAIVYGLGGMIGARLSGWVVTQTSIKIAFLGSAALAALGALAMWAMFKKYTKESPRQNK